MRIIKQDLKIHIYSRAFRIIWSKNGKRHREDGPALIWDGLAEYYYIKDRYYNKDEYWNLIHANY